jgi:hypothetical protein
MPLSGADMVAEVLAFSLLLYAMCRSTGGELSRRTILLCRVLGAGPRYRAVTMN